MEHMDDWIKVGLRYINLANVTEVHVRERPLTARVFFTGGGVAELDEDDAHALLGVLDQHARIPEGTRRTIIPPP
jgi:hypothetical protein